VGTILSLARLNQVLSLDTQAGRVRLQAGVKLADLHDWLGARVRGTELPPQPTCSPPWWGGAALAWRVRSNRS
jgi:FAD/FMN-containing dehydrogenase